MKKYLLGLFIIIFSYSAYGNNEKALEIVEAMKSEVTWLHQAQNMDDIQNKLPSFSDENIEILKNFQFSEGFLLAPTESDILFFSLVEQVFPSFQNVIAQKAYATHQDDVEIKLWASFMGLKIMHAMVMVLQPPFENFPKDDPTYETRQSGFNQMRQGMAQMAAGHILMYRGASPFNSPFLQEHKTKFMAYMPRLIHIYDEDTWPQFTAQIQQGFIDYPKSEDDQFYDEMFDFAKGLEALTP